MADSLETSSPFGDPVSPEASPPRTVSVSSQSPPSCVSPSAVCASVSHLAVSESRWPPSGSRGVSTLDSDPASCCPPKKKRVSREEFQGTFVPEVSVAPALLSLNRATQSGSSSLLCSDIKGLVTPRPDHCQGDTLVSSPPGIDQHRATCSLKLTPVTDDFMGECPLTARTNQRHGDSGSSVGALGPGYSAYAPRPAWLVSCSGDAPQTERKECGEQNVTQQYTPGLTQHNTGLSGDPNPSAASSSSPHTDTPLSQDTGARVPSYCGADTPWTEGVSAVQASSRTNKPASLNLGTHVPPPSHCGTDAPGTEGSSSVRTSPHTNKPTSLNLGAHVSPPPYCGTDAPWTERGSAVRTSSSTDEETDMSESSSSEPSSPSSSSDTGPPSQSKPSSVTSARLHRPQGAAPSRAKGGDRAGKVQRKARRRYGLKTDAVDAVLGVSRTPATKVKVKDPSSAAGGQPQTAFRGPGSASQTSLLLSYEAQPSMDVGLSNTAQQSDEARLKDRSQLSDKALLLDKAQLSDTAGLSDKARLSLSDRTQLSDTARPLDKTQPSLVSDTAWLSDKARLSVSDTTQLLDEGQLSDTMLSLLDGRGEVNLSCLPDREGGEVTLKCLPDRDEGEVTLSCLSDREGGEVSLSCLPEVLLLHIFSFVGLPTSLTALSRVCRRWSSALLDPSLWRRLDLRDLPRLRDADLLKVSSLSDRVSSLVLSGGLSTLLTDQGVVKAVQQCPHLTKVKFNRCFFLSDEAFESVGRQCRGLVCLNLSGCFTLTNRTLLAIGAGCPLLQDLDIGQCAKVTDVGVVAVAKGCPRLTRLRLDQCGKVPRLTSLIDHIVYNSIGCFPASMERLTNKAVEAVADHCPGLTHLHLLSCSLSDAGVNHLVKLPHLVVLDLSNLSQLSPRCVEGVASACPALQTLALSLNRAVDDQCLHHVVKRCPLLKCLSCVACCLSDLGLQHIAQHARNLERLDVAWCSDITDAGVTQVSAACPRLRYLGIMRCGLITMATVETLLLRHPHIQFSNFELESRRLLARAAPPATH